MILILGLIASANAAELPVRFINALHQVESSGQMNPKAGDSGAAIGPFQIHYEYWLDSGVKGSYSQCNDYKYSLKVITSYLNRYGSKYIKNKNYLALARIHNGGPRGAQWQSTISYGRKVISKI